MHHSVLSFLLLAATATLTLASPSHAVPALSRRNGPLAKQRLHNRAHHLKRSSPSSASSPSTRRTRSRRAGSPMAESLEERNMVERDHNEDKRALLDGLGGSGSGLLGGGSGLLGGVTNSASSSTGSGSSSGLPSVPGSSVLSLVKLNNLLNTGSSGMNDHQAKIGTLFPFLLSTHPSEC